MDLMESAPAPASSPETTPYERPLRIARRLLMGLAVAAAVTGLGAVIAVVLLGVSHQRVPSELVGPFLALLPVAFVALILTVLLGAVQRRLN